MHEISLVRSIFRTLKEEFPEEKLNRMQAIHLKVGKLSNVEPILLENAFQAVISEVEEYAHLQLEIERIPVEILCENCGKKSHIENYIFKCAHCGNPSRNIVQGTELLIHRVDFLTEEVNA